MRREVKLGGGTREWTVDGTEGTIGGMGHVTNDDDDVEDDVGYNEEDKESSIALLDVDRNVPPLRPPPLMSSITVLVMYPLRL